MLDMTTHRPVDVLDGREADPLAAWLTQHPEIEIITRDRASAYSEAARRGAPQATQCADRWHLWQNLCQAVEKTVVAHRRCLTESSNAGVDSSDAADHTPEAVTGEDISREDTEAQRRLDRSGHVIDIAATGPRSPTGCCSAPSRKPFSRIRTAAR
ncbi:transposase [Nocardia terpenica]|uniref:Transposase IS204/IS1001/IS1096/IS1165 DDE domain-containing protein n=1 Tax=Nocardia terpenica TaxID=455432 RepID=A0A291RRT3_9NOCA|nr:transposase [Nocardia terpenica]ATL69952.1 hypothetical protein CRH09_31010 [Nocardia terpenica]